MTTIYVSKEKSQHPLLSEKSSQNLKLITYNEEFMVNRVRMMELNYEDNPRLIIEKILSKK